MRSEAGGMMRYGIPKYRLPREVLDAEIERIVRTGVTIEYGREVTDLAQEMKEGKYDAVFLGVGAHLARRTYIPAGDASRVLDAVSVLKDVAEDEKPMLGRRVAIYGGGNTAIDVARTVRRMGAEPLVVYRRTRDRAPAHQTEIQEAIRDHCREEYFTIIMRRFMMRIAEAIGRDHGAKCLVTGENLGQVASQTMDAMAVTGAVVHMPIFHPLIGMDKEEIVTVARRIGTLDTSILPYEDCCTVFTPKHPKTKPVLAQVEAEEQKLDVEGLIARAIANTEKTQIRYYEDEHRG